MWNIRTIQASESLAGKHSVSIKITNENQSTWSFTAVHGPATPKSRDELWEELAGLSSLCGQNWCIGGDFNVIRSIREKNTCKKITKSMTDFDCLISELKLIEPPLANAKFTWSNLKNEPICCRLDRFLISSYTHNTNTRSWGELYRITFLSSWILHW